MLCRDGIGDFLFDSVRGGQKVPFAHRALSNKKRSIKDELDKAFLMWEYMSNVRLQWFSERIDKL